jgi:long-chain acyl-CoA synthetase
MTIVTAYSTLGEEGLVHSLIETNAKAIFLDAHLVGTLAKALQTAVSVRYVIYHGELSATDLASLKCHNLSVFHYDDVVKLGQSDPVDAVPPQPTDLACIMYTSGSMGKPKGVLLTHWNVIAAGKSAMHLAKNSFWRPQRIGALV